MNPKTLVAISFIENNLHHAIGVAEIAPSVRLSRSRLSYLFGTQIGMPPARYLKKLRMEKARELLETSFLSIKEIAAKVGYNDCTHFMREFKKAYHLTPSQHRAEYLAHRLCKDESETKNRRIG